MAELGIDTIIQFHDGDGYQQVSGAKDFSLSSSGTEVDISRFGDTVMRRVQTITDVSGSISGTHEPGDTGTAAIIAAGLASGIAAEGELRFLYDGTNGFEVAALISSVDFNITSEGVLEFTCNYTLDSTGRGLTVLSA